jgi:hypothetical protein
MATLLLPTGHRVLVDDADYPTLAARKWHLNDHGYVRGGATRAERAMGWPKRLLLHRLIATTPRGADVRHANGDRLDCRRANLLRAWEPIPPGTVLARPHEGTYRFRNRWRARITVNGRRLDLGSYDDRDVAAAAYRDAVVLFRQ